MPIPVHKAGRNIKANVVLIKPGRSADAELPAYYMHYRGYPTYISCWSLSWRERLQVLLGGHVWLTVVSDNHPSVRIDVVEPSLEIR